MRKDTRTFEDLTKNAQKSPIYWLECAVLDLERKIYESKKRQGKNPKDELDEIKLAVRIRVMQDCVRLLNKTGDEAAKVLYSKQNKMCKTWPKCGCVARGKNTDCPKYTDNV